MLTVIVVICLILFWAFIMAASSIADCGIFLLLAGGGFFLFWMFNIIKAEIKHDNEHFWKDDD